MTKVQTHYVCQTCGRTSPRAMGRCPQCGGWGTMVEEAIASEPAVLSRSASPGGLGGHSKPRRLDEIEGDQEDRWNLSIGEFARVLGGGVVPGSIVLVGGDPGIGKSTLVLQVMLEMAGQGCVLYVSGEESERQVKMRAVRLLTDEEGKERPLPHGLLLVNETNLNTILEHVAEVKPSLLVVDSIQTVYLSELTYLQDR